jgi:cellobiose-specific phosphotransferase system component IIB
MPQHIDIIPTEKSIIDLSQLPKNSFDSALIGYDLAEIMDDVILAKFVDETETGEMMRNGIVISTNAQTNAWRIGQVILTGPNVRGIVRDDFIMFPNNLGIPISNITVDSYGKVNKGIFINQARIFGKCSLRKETNTIASKSSKPKKSSVK